MTSSLARRTCADKIHDVGGGIRLKGEGRQPSRKGNSSTKPVQVKYMHIAYIEMLCKNNNSSPTTLHCMFCSNVI